MYPSLSLIVSPNSKDFGVIFSPFGPKMYGGCGVVICENTKIGSLVILYTSVSVEK